MSNENKNINTWDFVEKYYPDYHSSDKIAEFLDLDKDLEENGDGSLRYLSKEIFLDEMKVKIYEEAIKAFLEQEKQKEETEASIVWTVKDFESKAESIFTDLKEDEDESVLGMESWEELFDKTKFKETLKGMIENHDSEYGVNWFTIQCWLESDCKFKK